MSPRVAANRREQYFEERRNQILDAAIVVFGQKGLDGATVDDIANDARISKGTIYLYFKSKDEIFDAILSERSVMPQISELMETSRSLLRSAELPLHSFLELICQKFFEGIDSYHPLLRLVLADAHRFPLQAQHVYNNLILKANQMLAAFLSDQVKAGRIRPLDSPLIAARCFISMLIGYVLSQELLGGKQFTPINHEDWTREMVRLFLEGVRVSE